MNVSEINIRNYLKTFTAEDIANSVYLFGIDFDKASIESIMSALNSLYEEVKTLKSIVDRNFESTNGERLPKDSMIQERIIQDCYRKEEALKKALSNKDIYDTFLIYKKAEDTKTPGSR